MAVTSSDATSASVEKSCNRSDSLIVHNCAYFVSHILRVYTHTLQLVGGLSYGNSMCKVLLKLFRCVKTGKKHLELVCKLTPFHLVSKSWQKDP